MLWRHENFLLLLIAKQRSSSVVYTAKENFEVNLKFKIKLYLNQQSALIKEIFSNSELLRFCHLEGHEWCKGNFCIPLFSVLLTRWSCNGSMLLFHHWRNQRNIGFSKVVTYYSLDLFLLIEGSCIYGKQSVLVWFIGR